MSGVLRTTSNNADFNKLVLILERELRERYGAIQDLYEPHNKVVGVNTAIIAYKNNLPVGCGCFKKYDNTTIEVKRMFVEASHRGEGISKLILNELESWAIELGYKRSILETGLRQPESIGLYEKAGYKQIANYEPYMEMVESVCFGKELVK